MGPQQDGATGRLIVISGPSGSGKSTLTREAVARTGARLSISATTRSPGPGEQDGRDYYFLTREAFEAKIAAGEFLEYAEVFGNYYGTPSDTVREALIRGETIILEIDVQGGLQVFERMPEAVGVLILPPGEAVLRERLLTRAREDASVIEKRLAKARWEIEQAQQSGRYRHTIVNDQLAAAIERLVEIVHGGR